MQHTAIFHAHKNDNFHLKFFDYFLIFAQNIDIKVGCKGVYITRTCYHDENTDNRFSCGQKYTSRHRYYPYSVQDIIFSRGKQFIANAFGNNVFSPQRSVTTFRVMIIVARKPIFSEFPTYKTQKCLKCNQSKL